MNDAVAAVVIEDEKSEPVLMVAAHALVEVRAAVDGDWATPGFRLEAMLKAHDALNLQLRALGYKRVIALLEPARARSFGRRLKKLRGWFRSRLEPWVREV